MGVPTNVTSIVFVLKKSANLWRVQSVQIRIERKSQKEVNFFLRQTALSVRMLRTSKSGQLV